MTNSVVWRMALMVVLAIALSTQGTAQGSAQVKLAGLVNHYTASLDAQGPWYISGHWTLWVKGNSGKADFSAVLSMVRSDNVARQAHTHHVTLNDGAVTQTATGFEITGTPILTSNGNAAFGGSTIRVQVSGGDAVEHSNILVSFTGPAVGHFGADAIGGVVE